MRLAEPDAVQIVAVSPNGSQILTAGSAGALRVWDAWLNEPVDLLRVAGERIHRLFP